MKSVPVGLLSLSPGEQAFNPKSTRKPSGKWGPESSGENLAYCAPGGWTQDVGTVRPWSQLSPHVAHDCLAPVRSQAHSAYHGLNHCFLPGPGFSERTYGLSFPRICNPNQLFPFCPFCCAGILPFESLAHRVGKERPWGSCGMEFPHSSPAEAPARSSPGEMEFLSLQMGFVQHYGTLMPRD